MRISFIPFLIACLVSAAPIHEKKPVVKRALESRVNVPPACAIQSATSSLLTSASKLVTIQRRIAQQDLGTVAQSWQTLCQASGGDTKTNDPCVTLAGINGINALLANADPCAQQDNADAMITFAKSAGVTNTQALIDNALAYRRHARNAVNINGVIPSTVYCGKAPNNPELMGVVNQQLPGVNPGMFGDLATDTFVFGGPGSCPYGQTADLETCSCHIEL